MRSTAAFYRFRPVDPTRRTSGGPASDSRAGSSSQRAFLQTRGSGFHTVSSFTRRFGAPPHTTQSGFSRRATRWTAAVMLFVWLMALGTGIANACLANDEHVRHGHLDHRDGALVSAPASGHDPTQVTAPVQRDPGDPSPSPAKVTCQNFCAAGQSSLLKQQGDGPGPLLAAPMLAASWWSAPPSPDRHSLWSVRGDPAGSQPPIPIRFLRLTI